MIDPSQSTDREPVERLAEEFVERHRCGERPSLTEYTTRCPELAEEIRDLFPALVMIERLKPAVEDPIRGLGDDDAASFDSFSPPDARVGDYRIVREIGRGGMGVVYEAVQESMGAHVALKILPKNTRLGPTQIGRFQLEARSAGRLQHGNIVPVYGVGEHQGMHYYAMQFIHGHGLDAILDDLRRLRGDVKLNPGTDSDTRSSRPAEPTGSMAAARSLLTGQLEAGHDLTGNQPTLPATAERAATITQDSGFRTAGALMRMEPTPAMPGLSSADTSILSSSSGSKLHRAVARIGLQVAEALSYAHGQGVLHRDIKPSNLLLDAVGNIWVTDFGLAKVEGSDGPTSTGDIVGTIRYMAPERFDAWSDRRSDVYSLGATLYELITLCPLFAGVVHAELIQKVLHAPPESPRKLDSKIPRDLETIVLKAIAKEPGDRYATAGAMGDDLRRFLEDRPVLARRITPVEQTWRWCRRNRLLAAASVLAVAVTLILAVVSTIAAWTYRDQRDAVRRAEIVGRERLFDSLAAQARATRFSGRIGQRFDSLQALEKAVAIARELKLPEEQLDHLREEAIASLALPDLKKTSQVAEGGPPIAKYACDSNMTRYAQRFVDGTIVVRRMVDNGEIARFRARGDREIHIFEFSPDGRYLATTHVPGFALTVWDVDRETVALEEPGPVGGFAARFSPDSSQIAVGRVDGSLIIHDLAAGRSARRLHGPAGPGDLAFRPDGTRVAVVYHSATESKCQVIELATGRLVQSIPLIGWGTVSWSPDGTTLATPCEDSKIYLWDADTGVKKVTLEGATNSGLRAAFHPSGTLIASNGWEGRLRIWDTILGRPVLSLSTWLYPQFSRDGRIVVAQENAIMTFEADPAIEYRTFAHVSSPKLHYDRPAVHPDGRILAVGTDHGVVLWDLAHGTELAFLPIEHAWHALFDASGSLFTSGRTGVHRWPISRGTARGEYRIGPPGPPLLPGGVGGIDIDRTGRIVAQGGGDYAFVSTPKRAFAVWPLDDVRIVAVSPDARWLATGSHQSGGAQVWRIEDATKIAELPIAGGTEVTFSGDGKWLMTDSAPCQLWNVGSWLLARQIGGSGLCFSPDGREVAVVDADRAIRLVQCETGRTLAKLETPDQCAVRGAVFSPDGARLVLTTHDGPAVHVWDLRAIRRQLARIGLDWDAPAFPDADPASPVLPVLPPFEVDFGPQPLPAEIVPGLFEGMIADMEARLARKPEERGDQPWLVVHCDLLTRSLADRAESNSVGQGSKWLARRLAQLGPKGSNHIDTLGVDQYHGGDYAKAVATLEHSLTVNRGQHDAFYLLFLSMAHHRLGHRAEAQKCYDRAVQWLGQQKHLHYGNSRAFTAFRTKVEAVLAERSAELPLDVFTDK